MRSLDRTFNKKEQSNIRKKQNKNKIKKPNKKLKKWKKQKTKKNNLAYATKVKSFIS